MSRLKDGAIALRTAVLDALPLEVSRGLRYFYHGRRWPNLVEPRGLNEKINWRVLNDQRELWTWTCDKLAMKREAVRRVAGLRVPRTLWYGMDLSELAEVALPERWILKPNNSSGRVIAGSGTPDLAALQARVSRWDAAYQWRSLGELAYLRADPGYLVEEWIGDGATAPDDYKLFVFDGTVRFIHAHTARFGRHEASLYTPDWTRIHARQSDIEPHERDLPRPHSLEQMVSVAAEVARGFDFMRIDLFDVGGEVWFGETTPYPWSGGSPFFPWQFELEAGSYWTLPDLSSSGKESLGGDSSGRMTQ